MSDFNPKEHMLRLKGKDYLPVVARVAWFREKFPNYGILTAPAMPLEHTVPHNYAVYQATITDENGRVLSQATKLEDQKDFGDFIEKAETGAIGRALANLGVGTLQAQQDLDDGSEERGEVVDSPVPSRRGEMPAQPRQQPRPGPIASRGVQAPQRPAQRPQPAPQQTAERQPRRTQPPPEEPEEDYSEPTGESGVFHADNFDDARRDEEDAMSASAEFRDFARSVGVRIENDHQELMVINRLLKRQNGAASLRPRAEDYRAARATLTGQIKSKNGASAQ